MSWRPPRRLVTLIKVVVAAAVLWYGLGLLFLYFGVSDGVAPLP